MSEPEIKGGDETALRLRKQRARNIAIFLALLVWVIIVYIAIMVKVHHEIRG